MSRPRSGSAAERILGSLLDQPVISTESARRISGASAGSTSEALSRLEADGVLREITGRTKNKVWAAVDVTAELDDLQVRIAKRVHAARETEVQT
jgi:predicted transcriptional regulator